MSSAMSADSSVSGASDDLDAASHRTDPLDLELLSKLPRLKEEPEFNRLNRVQKMFVYLLSANIKESTHVEFKTSVCDSENWRFRLLRSACAMYNGLDPLMREPSLTDQKLKSSYIVYGVKERDRKLSDLSKHLVPLKNRPGEEEIQDCFRSNTTPPVAVYLHLVRFEVTMRFNAFDLDVPAGMYALIEVPRGQYGPAVFKDCAINSKKASGSSKDRKEVGSKKISSGLLSYTRTDAQNVPGDEWDVRCLREKVHEQFNEVYDFQALSFVKDDLIAQSESFKLLILTSFSSITHPTHKESLARALGQGRWDVIMDFDVSSREQGGHFTPILEEIEKDGRLYSVYSWKQLPRIDAKDLDECQRGQRTIYVQAMGCSNTRIPEPTNADRLKKNIKSKFLELIFERNHCPRPVVCVTLCLTATAKEILNLCISPGKVASYVKSAFVSESDSDVSLKSVLLCTEESVRQQLIANTKSEMLLTPPDQLCFMFELLYSKSNVRKSYELPGVSGPFSILPENVATYRPYIRLYHANSGQKKYQGMSEDQRRSYCYEKLKEFLVGNELTKKMLHMHEELRYQSSGIYIERREIEKYRDKVAKSLAHLNQRSFSTWNANTKQVIHFRHEPSSGATTIARIVLWRLRKEYPCVEVKNASRLQEAIEGICYIYDRSKLPVLVLFDSTDFSQSTVHNFVTELNKLRPITKSVVLFVEKVVIMSLNTPHLSTIPKQRDSDDRILSVKLSDEEAREFDKIYQRCLMESGGDILDKLTDKVENETVKTSFLFGVWHFKQEYRKLDGFVFYLIKEASESKKKLLGFASLVQLFTHTTLDLSIAAQFFSLPPEQKSPEKVFDRLGIQRTLLIVKKVSGVWGLQPILIVGERILNMIFVESEKEPNKQKQQICTFVNDLCEMAEKGSRQLLFCLQTLVQRLTSGSKRLLDPQRRFTDFLFLMHNLSADEIEAAFERLAQSFPEAKPHILIHCARYFAYQKSEFVKSLDITRKALELEKKDKYFSDTKCADDVVLSLSSHLINCRLDSGTEMQFSDAQTLALDSIRLCKLAQDKQRPSRITGDLVHRAHPFCCEIQAQRLLLKLFFCLVCQQDHKRYFREIGNEQYLAVKEAHFTILENIFNLEKMQENDLLEQETLTDKELRKLNETKVEFISRYHPSGESLSAFKKLCPEVSDIAFAWTIVDFWVFHIEKSEDKEDFGCGGVTDQQFDNLSLTTNFTTRQHGMWDRIRLIQKIKDDKIYEKLLTILLSCPSMLPKNYFEACALFILLKPKNALKHALAQAFKWCQKFSHDFHAKFMHGCLQLALALSQSSTELVRREALVSAKKAFYECDCLTFRETATRRKRTLPGSNCLRFFLSQGDNINSLVFLPRMRSYAEQEGYIKGLKPRLFSGYLSQANSLVCRELDNWELHVPSMSSRQEQFKQKKEIQFAIALAYCGLTPIIF